jgi:UDP-glucose 4-epimerase
VRILVLGGNGFIGSHLVDKLLRENHYVRVFDRNEEHYRKALANVDYFTGEFGNRGLLSEALDGIDIVIHMISSTLPKTSNDDPAFDIQSNVVDSLFLLEQCVAKKIKKIIFISSGGTIYGYPQSLPVKEDHQTNPICSYGIGKLTIEKYLYLFKELYDLDYVILRPSNPYGSRQNPFGIQGVISVFIGKILRNETIEIWGDGSVVRDYIYVADLVEAIYLTISCESSYRLFNVGMGKGYSLMELLSVIKNISGCDIKISNTPTRACDVPKIYLDITRATEELNWTPSTSIETGIKYTWDFIKNIL